MAPVWGRITLRVKYRTDYRAYVFQLPVWHRSTGKDFHDDNSFWRLLSQVSEKYLEDEFDVIYAPTGHWHIKGHHLIPIWERAWRKFQKDGLIETVVVGSRDLVSKLKRKVTDRNLV